jgi:hypothetical protein
LSCGGKDDSTARPQASCQQRTQFTEEWHYDGIV